MRPLRLTLSSSTGTSPMTVILGLVVLAGLFLFPHVVQSPYALHIMILLFLATIQGEAWDIIGGYTGQYSVGHAAYFGAGAYTTMILLQYRQIPPWYGMVAGIVVALLVWLILELRGLTRVLREEVKPILGSAQETINTVRGTTSFVSDNVVAPFVKVQGYVAGAKTMMDVLFGRVPMETGPSVG